MIGNQEENVLVIQLRLSDQPLTEREEFVVWKRAGQRLK